MVVLQFLRGDRESIPWILAVILLILVWHPYSKGKNRAFPKATLLIVFVVMFAVSSMVGYSRSRISGLNDISSAVNVGLKVFTENPEFFKGTWTAVLLTPLSVAGEYVKVSPHLLYGKDYLNLILSLPPGFLADALNYERPWSLGRGPATEMLYGLGGTHASVLPFRNFGIIGVFIINYWIFDILTKMEKKWYKRPSMKTTLLLPVLITVFPHWLWYGEKNILNGLMMFYILYFGYKISIKNTQKLF